MRWKLSGLFGLVFLPGCGTPLGPCYQEAVVVALSGTLDGAPLASSGRVGPANIASYPDVKAYTIDGESLPGRRITWTIDALNGAGYLAVELPGTILSGQVWASPNVFVGGGWGVAPGSGSGVAVSARFDANQAVVASGTISVVAIKPLRVRLDLTLTDAQNVARRIQGVAEFSYRREASSCT